MDLKNITLSKVKLFLEGNSKYYLAKLSSEPKFLEEQRLLRLYLCKDDCLTIGTCQNLSCGCPTEKRIFTNESCNKNRFPDIMPKANWEEFKKANAIDEDFLDLIKEEIENIKSKK